MKDQRHDKTMEPFQELVATLVQLDQLTVLVAIKICTRFVLSP